MEFRFRAGDERGLASSSSGYFAEQALRAGLDVGRDGPVPRPAMSRADALLAELREKRRREEVLEREIALERREEQIMRELEMEREWPARRFEEGRFSPSPLGTEDRAGVGPLRRSLEMIRERDRASPSMTRPHRDIVMDVTAVERPPVKKSMFGKAGLLKLLSKPESSGTKKEEKRLDHQTSGVKRKAAIELRRPAKKEWRCSLCNVTATRQKALNAHLRGKVHQSKIARLANNKATSSDARNKQVHRSSNDAWCGLCNVTCNSHAMLDNHLKGRRHQARLESRRRVGTDVMQTQEVVKEVTEEVEAEDKVQKEYSEGKRENVGSYESEVLGNPRSLQDSHAAMAVGSVSAIDEPSSSLIASLP